MTITDETPETIDGAARVRQRGDDAAVLRLSEAEAAAIGTDATTPTTTSGFCSTWARRIRRPMACCASC